MGLLERGERETYAAPVPMREHETPPAGPARDTSERTARERLVVALLRQLWLGLSTYRLYPENPNRPGFAPAVERVRATAEEALGGGPVDVEVRGDRFVMAGEPLPQDDALDRLSRACFERRVERLTVVAVPDTADLESLYETLSRSAPDLEEAGGAEAVLSELGVTSVSLSPIGPGTVDEADHVPEDLVQRPEERRLDADVLASELMVEDLGGDPHDQAETLLARLRRIIGGEGAGPGIDMHSAVHDLMTDLPEHVRRSFVEILVDRVRRDPVAERLIGTMSSADLTRALVDIGRGGTRDPVELARQLATAGVRQVDVVDLTRALAVGHEDAGTIIAGLEQLGVDVGSTGELPGGGSVLEVLAGYLSATENDDVRSIRAAIESSADEMHGLQALAVADYLALEIDMERAGEALDIWADELRRVLRERDEREIAALLQPVRTALLGGGEERAALFDAYVRRVLQEDLVLDVVIADAADELPRAAALLGPFGAPGVEVLLDLLAEEEDRSRRASLLGALRQIGPAHPGLLATRLSDERWYVVRNAVALLGSAGDPGSVPRVAEAARHPSPEVRHEVAPALVGAGGPAAIPHLVRLALDGVEDVRIPAVTALGTLAGEEAAEGLAEVARQGFDRAVRIHALDRLAERAEGPRLLDELRTGRGEGRLPWRLRRYAKRLLSRSSRGHR